MKVFLDANILVSVLNKEYPLFNSTARILSLADKPTIRLYTSSSCLAIAWYFACKKSGAVVAKKKMALLGEKLYLAHNSSEDIITAATHKKIDDFEDGLQYLAALQSGCVCIVTENVKDYYFAEMPVLNAEAFLEHHAHKK